LSRLQVRHEYRADGKEEISQVIEQESLKRDPLSASRAKIVTDVVDRLPEKDRLYFVLAVLGAALIAFGLWLRFGR
jgi:hypothetical protein